MCVQGAARLASLRASPCTCVTLWVTPEPPTPGSREDGRCGGAERLQCGGFPEHWASVAVGASSWSWQWEGGRGVCARPGYLGAPLTHKGGLQVSPVPVIRGGTPHRKGCVGILG